MVKKIGLVGGIGPASTVEYYRGIIEKCRKELDVYPKIVIDSVDMEQAAEYLIAGDGDSSARLMVESVSRLKAAGAEIAAITANTEHIYWDKMKERFEIPVVSIVDAAAEEILRMGYKKVLVLGTVYTMKSGLYEGSLISRGITPVLPTDEDKEIIGNLIYPNLENGIVIPEDRDRLHAIAEKYISETGAEAVLLGCTELPLAFGEGAVSVPLLDTTRIHINAIVKMAKEDGLWTDLR